jgi:glycosyltransferase involved in cell wall biosynthesis
VIRVAYDSQIFGLQQFGGISRYFCELAIRVAHAPHFAARVLTALHINDYLRDASIPGRGTYLRPSRTAGRLSRAVNLVYSPVAACINKPHVIHETYYRESKSSRPQCARVVTVFDMIYEKFRDMFPGADSIRRAKRDAVARADRIICISEQTRRDLIDILGVPEEKAEVVYLGFGMPQAAVEAAVPCPRPFLLYVGARAGYKNFDRLLTAFASSAMLRKQFCLVAFGGGKFNRVELERLRVLGLDDDSVVQVAGDDATLAGLYVRACCFVYPSLYEGFGIPPLEAMSLGCPVVSSNASSIPEVVGDAAALFHAEDVDSIRQTIENVVADDKLRSILVASGMQRIKQFSWERCASQTMDVYRALV